VESSGTATTSPTADAIAAKPAADRRPGVFLQGAGRQQGEGG